MLDAADLHAITCYDAISLRRYIAYVSIIFQIGIIS